MNDIKGTEHIRERRVSKSTAVHENGVENLTQLERVREERSQKIKRPSDERQLQVTTGCCANEL